MWALLWNLRHTMKDRCLKPILDRCPIIRPQPTCSLRGAYAELTRMIGEQLASLRNSEPWGASPGSRIWYERQASIPEPGMLQFVAFRCYLFLFVAICYYLLLFCVNSCYSLLFVNLLLLFVSICQKCYYLLLFVPLCCYLLLFVTTCCCYLSLFVIVCYYLLLCVAICCYLMLCVYLLLIVIRYYFLTVVATYY